MAIAQNDIVSVHLNSAALTIGKICAQPPARGIVSNAASAWTVLWAHSGVQQTGILDANLDVISNPTGASNAVIGKIVTIAGENPAYRFQVIEAYVRTTSAGVGSEVALCMNTQIGYYIEVLVSSLTVVP